MTPFISRSFPLVLGVVLLASGCRSVQRAGYAPKEPAARAAEKPVAHSSSTTSPDSSTSAGSDDSPGVASRWPARWGDHPDRRGVIIDLDPADPLRPIHLSRYQQLRSTDIEYNDANQLAADMGIAHGFKFQAEGPGSFLFIPNPKNESNPDLTKDSGKQSLRDIPDLAFKFVSATKFAPEKAKSNQSIKVSSSSAGITRTLPSVDPNILKPRVTIDEDHVELQRTWFTYRDPKPKDPAIDPLGTIILLPGMFGTPDLIIDGLENYWHNRGYAVLRMRSHPSRFTEHYEFKLNPEMTAGDAEKVARMNDDRVAEGAYATKGALDHLLSKRPNLADKPVILVGMSGGAMMLPTVYAYAPDDYDAAVIIAGGANFLEISLDSNYKSWIDAIIFDFDPDPDKEGEIKGENRDNFLGNYLIKSKLDSFHTATEMGDVPVLMLHGTTDKAVPAATGQLLYQQLGKPERWSYPVGHELIFIGLPTQVARIDRWISAHVLDAEKERAAD